MKKLLSIFLIAGVLSAGCAKIPVESVQLNDAIMKEGARMHNINTAMINDLFNEKKRQVSEFIETEYTPAYIKKFTTKLDSEDVTLETLPRIVVELIPEITRRHDEMIQALEEQRLKLTNQLNIEYQAYYDASITLHNLLQSAAQVDKERAALNDRISQLSGNKIDFNKVEHSVDEFITRAGSPNGIQDAVLDLNNSINEILTQQK